MRPAYKDDLVKLFHGDSLEVLDQLKPRDLVLTDWPYGLNKSWKRKFHGRRGKTRLGGSIPDWDTQTISKELFNKVFEAGERHIFWGGNFYNLPPSRCWFIWDKLQTNRGADCELAWTDLEIAPKVFRMSRIDAYFNKAVFKKFHPAEKPIQLGQWCLKYAEATTMIDPFCGSGSFVVAAKRLGIPCVGIDIDEENIAESIRRLESL